MASADHELRGTPLVSTRLSITWPPNGPYEDSDVLVLSSRATSTGVGATLLYIDLRLSLPLTPASTITWGFGGLRHTLSVDPRRYRWDHALVDSRGDGLADEGENEQREVDGVEVDVETGMGFNPLTGKVQAYEEVWRDKPIGKGTPYVFLTSTEEAGASTAFMAVIGPHGVALAQDPPEKRFHALRMRRHQHSCSAEPAEHKDRMAWDTLYSTNSRPLEEQLKAVLDLVNKERGTSTLRRRQQVNLGVGRWGRVWTVWDAGVVAEQERAIQ